jgi:hypothetical protein
MLLDGWHSYVTGRADDAEAIYRRVLDRYPNEVEAWLQAGEIAFHHAASRGQTTTTARAAFERVLTLDPDHEAAHVHLARIAGQAGDLPSLTRHTDYLIARRPGSGVALEMAALKAFANRDRKVVDSLRPAFMTQDGYTVLATLMTCCGNRRGPSRCAPRATLSERSSNSHEGIAPPRWRWRRGRKRSMQPGVSRRRR